MANRDFQLRVWLGVLALSLFLLPAPVGAQGHGTLRHVGAFKFAAGVKQEEEDRVVNAFRELQRSIPEIRAFESGLSISPEGLDKEFTHCFILSFASEKDRDTYLEHPEHQAFGKLLAPDVADVFAVDFRAQ